MNKLKLGVLGIEISWHGTAQDCARIRSDMAPVNPSTVADAGVSGLEELILAHYKRGFDVKGEAYCQAVEEAYSNLDDIIVRIQESA